MASPSAPEHADKQTGLPSSIHQQLTAQERELLSRAKARVKYVSLLGYVTGAASTYYYLYRRKAGPPKSIWKTFLLCSAGSLLTSTLLLPFAIVRGREDLKRVEDPDHLRTVLREAQIGKEMGPPRSVVQPGQQGQRAPGGDAGIVRQPSYPQGSTAKKNTNQWGDEMGAPEMAYSNDYANAPSVDQYTPPTSRPEAAPATPNEQQQGKPSRWEELRRERGVQASGWDKIRQQKAKEMYNQQSANGQGQPGQAAYDQEGTMREDQRKQSGEGLADPTFGKGVSSSREQAQRQYERSFDRERRGLDG